MGVFDEVLIDCARTVHKLTKSFESDDTDFKFKGAVVGTTGVDGLTNVNVEGKTLSPGNVVVIHRNIDYTYERGYTYRYECIA